MPQMKPEIGIRHALVALEGQYDDKILYTIHIQYIYIYNKIIKVDTFIESKYSEIAIRLTIAIRTAKTCLRV